MWISLYFLVTVYITHIRCANILGIIPTASYSHQVPFQPLWRELSLRGHSVTVITTNPMKDQSIVNLTEIDISYTRNIYKKYKFLQVASDASKGFLEIADVMINMLGEADETMLSSPEIQNLINDKSLHFDLLIVEAQLPGMMAFSWRFNCPMIGIASLDSAVSYHKYMGNPRHPVVNPDNNLPVGDAENMTFRERLKSFFYNIIYEHVFVNHKVYPQSYERFKRFFGEDLPYLDTLYQNMAMLFVNTNPIFHNMRPLNPNTIAIGGTLHIKKPKPLPNELQKYLDNSKEGVIYFSLGSNIPGYLLTNISKEILMSFSELPYNFLLKTDLELENIPDNVNVGTWFPQQDLLRHPYIKLIITQGGLQTLQEAVINGIPVIGIPFFGDQFSNVNKAVKKGYGIKLDKDKITKESMKNAIWEIMDNLKYRERVQEISEILKDEEMPGLQKAMWWTEYVIRHKGASHLRSPIVTLPFWKFYMLDVISFIGLILSIFTFVLRKILKLLFNKMKKSNNLKLKEQ